MPTLSIGDCIGWCGIALIGVQTAILGWAFVAFVLVLGVTTTCVAREIAYRASERQERARLLEQAKAQHAAWLAGDDDWGVYGISPIATTERVA
jgi:ABC-type transport system involved in cytochrome bd biosynthesis fused ATPase/permease subunit